MAIGSIRTSGYMLIRLNEVIIVKTSADPNFMEEDNELKHVEFFRAIADEYLKYRF